MVSRMRFRKADFVIDIQGGKHLSQLKNGGYTLLETMLALAIFTVIVFFFPMIIPSFQSSHDDQLKIKEAELFFAQTRRDIHQAIQVNASGNVLYVTFKNGDTATYERYGTSIRRRLNGEGHEIMLQNIRDLSFQTKQNMVAIRVTGPRGRTFERKITTMVKADE